MGGDYAVMTEKLDNASTIVIPNYRLMAESLKV
jgi:hypothetical protein